jgi:hypothetical protein
MMCTMNREDDPEQVRHLLDQRGYKRVFWSRPDYKGPEVLCYKAPANGPDVDGYVFLEKKPEQNAYDVTFGVTCKMAVELLEAAEPALRASTVIPAHSLGTPYVALFSAGRLLRCALINIPDRTDPRSLRQLLDELVELVLQPFVEGPKSCSDVLSSLRRDDLPFEWIVTNPVKRALHLAATARALGIDRQQVERELLAVKGRLRGDLSREQVWDNAVRFIVSILWSRVGARH